MSGFDARARLQRAMEAVVASSIEALAERLPSALPVPSAMRARAGADAAERTRTVLAIDSLHAGPGRVRGATFRCATRSACPGACPYPSPAIAPAPAIARPPAAAPVGHADDDVACDEPIRTRSMARLLAKQGHPKRALAIIEYLLARSEADAELRAEAEALRAAIDAAP